MKINQLFTSTIPWNVIEQLLEAFALNGLEDTRKFTLLDLERHHTVDKITALRSTLIEYYLPCKAKLYLTRDNQMSLHSSLTILRQVIKLHQYVLCSKQIYIMRKKITHYHIESLHSNVNKFIFKQMKVQLLF